MNLGVEGSRERGVWTGSLAILVKRETTDKEAPEVFLDFEVRKDVQV